MSMPRWSVPSQCALEGGVNARPTRVLTSTCTSSGPSSANSRVAKNSPKPSTKDGVRSRFLSSFMSLPRLLRGLDTRIEEADQDVDAEVCDEDRDRHEQRAAGDQGIVVAFDGGQDRHAKAWVTEDHLGDQRATDHGAEREREPGELRQHRVTEHVKEDLVLFYSQQLG